MPQKKGCKALNDRDSKNRLYQLIRHAAEEGKPTPTSREMSHVLDISRPTVDMYVRQLKETGFVITEHRGNLRVFRVGPHSTRPRQHRESFIQSETEYDPMEAYEPAVPEWDKDPFVGVAFEDDPRALRDKGSNTMPRSAEPSLQVLRSSWPSLSKFSK